MPRKAGVPRRPIAVLLAVALVGLSVAVPLLDRGARTGAWVIHGEHPLSSHPHAHDHTICTQHGAGSLPQLAVVDVPRAPDVDVLPSPAFDARIHSRVHATPLRSRAPPLA